MRVRGGIAVAALCAAQGVSHRASAQHFDGRVSLTASGTYNQTITDAPFPTALTRAGPSMSFSPSASLVHETPRSTHTFTYTFGLNLPFDRDFQLAHGLRSYTNRLGYSGRYQLSERSDMSVSLSFNHRPTSTLDIAADPSQTALDPIPAGAAYLLATSAQVGFTRQLAQDFSIRESTTLSYGAPIDPVRVLPKTLGVQASLSLDRQFTVDTLGLTGSVETSYFTAGEGARSAVIDPRVQISSTLQLSWIRSYTEAWSSTLAVGATQVVSPAAETPTAIQPTGTLAISYRLEAAVATLSFAHMTAPNLATGAVNFSDALSLRFSMPLGETGLAAAGSGGFTHMTPIGALDGVTSDSIVGDASLAWRPAGAQSFRVALRGQVQRQIVGADPTGAYTRLAASINLTYAWPSAGPAQVQLPPALGLLPPPAGEDFSRPSPEEPAPVREPVE